MDWFSRLVLIFIQENISILCRFINKNYVRYLQLFKIIKLKDQELINNVAKTC